MPTSATEAWDRGYQQAMATLFDEAKATDPKERRELKRRREELEHSGDYQGVRRLLDAASPDLFMTRFTAMFYLSMSPGVFKKALARGIYPFEPPQGGATKREVDHWFERLLQAKHIDAMPHVQPLRISRDLKSGRPYLVDRTGVILADGKISNIDPLDVAYAASIDMGIEILDLATALSRPWRDAVERDVWARWRRYLLDEKLHMAEEAVRNAQAEDMRAADPRKLPPGKRHPI